MEITLPTDDPPKRPVLPDNWGEDRPGKVPTPDFSKSIIWELWNATWNFLGFKIGIDPIARPTTKAPKTKVKIKKTKIGKKKIQNKTAKKNSAPDLGDLTLMGLFSLNLFFW